MWVWSIITADGKTPDEFKTRERLIEFYDERFQEADHDNGAIWEIEIAKMDEKTGKMLTTENYKFVYEERKSDLKEHGTHHRGIGI